MIPRCSKRDSQPIGHQVGARHPAAAPARRAARLDPGMGHDEVGVVERHTVHPEHVDVEGPGPPVERPACGWPSPPAGGRASSSSRASRSVSSRTTMLRYGPWPSRAADRIGLVDGRDGDEVRQQRHGVLQEPHPITEVGAEREQRPGHDRRLVMVTALVARSAGIGGRSLRTLTVAALDPGVGAEQLLGDAFGDPLQEQVRLLATTTRSASRSRAVRSRRCPPGSPSAPAFDDVDLHVEVDLEGLGPLPLLRVRPR